MISILKKIYLELMVIKKELQEIRKIPEPKHVDIYMGKEKMN